MLKVLSLFVAVLVSCGVAFAQNSNSSTTTERPRTSNTNRAKPTQTETQKPATTTPTPTPAAKKPAASTEAPGSEGVQAAFNQLVEGIKHANVKEVMSVYWNDPRLNLFNYNGTVTKGWEQVRKNRESSYPEITDVKLEIRDLSVRMLAPDSALVTCLWTQSQTYKGTPETASGRMSLVFKRYGTAWKAIHLHSSPETPNPAAIPPSEQQRPSPTPSPSPSPTP